MGVIARITHVSVETQTVNRFDITLAGYAGALTEYQAPADGLAFTYENLSVPDVFTNPIQRGRLEITAFGADSLYQAVTGATAGLYGIEWYQDDALQWKGEILGDLCTATEANTPNAFTFTAKDFTTLGSIDLPMTDSRLPVIEVLSTVLAFTGYNLPIRTVTAWINSDMSEGDFLRRSLIETRPLRVYANRTSEDSDKPISVADALTFLARTFKLFVSQKRGEILLEQVSAYEDVSDVFVSRYASNGAFLDEAVEARSQSVSVSLRVIQGTTNAVAPGYARVQATYNHRTVGQGIFVPDIVTIRDGVQRVFDQFFTPDGLRSVSFRSNGVVELTAPSTDAPFVQVELRAGNLFWNQTTSQWSAQSHINVFELPDTGSRVEGPATVWRGNINIQTLPVPAGQGGTLRLTLFGFGADVSRFTSNTFEILGPADERDSTAELYILDNVLSASERYDDGQHLYGDGPTDTALSAIRYVDGLNNPLTNRGWTRRIGPARNWTFSELLLHEVLDQFRIGRRIIDATLFGSFRPDLPLIYESTAFVFVGGRYDGYSGRWSATLLQIGVQVESDLLEVGLITGEQGITTGLYNAINISSRQAIEQAGVIPFRLAVSVQGLTSVLVVSFEEDAPVLAGQTIRVVHPVTLDSATVTVASNKLDGSNTIIIEPVELPFLPVGSWLFISPASIQAGIAIGTTAVSIFAESASIGRLTAPVSGLTESLPVRLFAPVIAGQDFVLQSIGGQPYYLTVSVSANVGATTLDIRDAGGAGQFVEAPAGAFLIADGRFNRASINVDPGRVQIGVEAEREANGIAVTTAPINAGAVISIPVTNAQTLTLRDGDHLIVTDRTGAFVDLTVTGEQSVTSGTTVINASGTATADIGAGAQVAQPAWNQTGEINVQAGRIDLLVTEVNGLDTSLAGLTLEVGELEQDVTTFRQTGRFAVTNDVVGFTGLLSTAVSGTTTSLEVGTALDFDLIVGDVLRLAPGTPEQTDVVVATAISGGAGNHTIAIDSIALPPIGSGAQIRFAEGERTELQIFPLIPLQLYSGQRVLIGAEVLTLSANYTLVASTNETIAFNTPITLTTYMSPSFALDVTEPGVEISSKTSVIGARAVLQTDVNGNLAQINLFSGTSDSNIKIQADFIVLEGQTTFLTDFYKNLSATSFVIVSDTAPDERPTTPTPTSLEIGDVWINTTGGLDLPYNWNGTGWIRGFTVVDAGNVTTGTLNANNVTIRASDSATTFVEINSSGITGKADDVVNFYLPNNTTDVPILRNFKVDSLIVESRTDIENPDQIIFQGRNILGNTPSLITEAFDMGVTGIFFTIDALENYAQQVGPVGEEVTVMSRGYLLFGNELEVKPLRNFLEVGVEFPEGWTTGVNVNNRLTVCANFDTAAEGKIYFRFNGSSVEDEERYFVLRGLPNSATGLPSGALWNDTGTIKIA
jgi:hypothetical protein